jgi:hypothetical protein
MSKFTPLDLGVNTAIPPKKIIDQKKNQFWIHHDDSGTA